MANSKITIALSTDEKNTDSIDESIKQINKLLSDGFKLISITTIIPKNEEKKLELSLSKEEKESVTYPLIYRG